MFQTIVVPLDGSALAQHALPIAARIARSAGGSLILFRAISPPPSYIWPTIEPPDFSEVIVTEHEKARGYLEQVAASNELSGIKVITDVLEGEPASMILALAQQYQASLIGVTILNGVKHTLSYECASQEVSLEGMQGL